MKSMMWLMVLLCLLPGCSRFEKNETSRDNFRPDTRVLPPGDGLPIDSPTEALRPSAVSAAKAPSVMAGQSAARKVIYTAKLRVRVANPPAAMQSIGEIVTTHGGFIQNSTMLEITFRVAPEQFEAALSEAGELGEVLQRDVRTQDVTAEYFDVQLRLDVAEKSRQRLNELLQNAAAVKDVLEVERDIRRLTEEIEQMKGSLRMLQDQLDLATISISLEQRAVVAVKVRKIARRFSWMNQTGIDQVMAETAPNAELAGGPWLWRLVHGQAFELEAPQQFVPLLNRKRDRVLSSPEDYRMRAVSHKINGAADLSFWADGLRHELQDNRGYLVRPGEEVAMQDKQLKAQRLRTQATFSGEAWVYDVWLIQRADTPDHLLVVEFAALEKDAAPLRAKADAAVEKVDYAIARAPWRMLF